MIHLRKRFPFGEANEEIGAELRQGDLRIKWNDESAACQMRPGIDSIVESDAESRGRRVQCQFGPVEQKCSSSCPAFHPGSLEPDRPGNDLRFGVNEGVADQVG